ncbi:Serine/threonine protein kinase [Desulfacinum infernum DSM 9756]|uniref:Serine/threonine protein kinase n=1 Tax=Desulfacinum infernum DSM 9756 TaxID=1121391 RepID=A0A1M5DV57_9BACT|nr:serine/threonine-protein kinase [Desulfacinum infernum]SHF70825.1 Serine/threonine protein kinase [Desulfacinum infernum DSM 9756]
MLVLLSEGRLRRVRDILRAGADDYWIPPLEGAPFATRLQLLLDWQESGRGARRTTTCEDEPHWLRVCRRGLRRIRDSLSLSRDAQRPEAAESARYLGRWEKVRRLGFGSFGEVWLVQEKDGARVAVAKVPHEEKMNRKFLMEAAILRRLAGHPNAVAILEVIKVGGKVVLIQEYVSGSTLQELLDAGLDPQAKENLYIQLLDVMAYAHRRHVMHRDIKPENILVTPAGTLKLLDFGTAKDVTRRSISSTVIGSRPYMAPEQILGRSRQASDVWALGVVLYALATEYLPFYSENEKELMDLILECPPEPPRELEPDLPSELEKIILRCLEKDWQKRYAHAEELRQALMEAFPDFGSGHVLSS